MQNFAQSSIRHLFRSQFPQNFSPVQFSGRLVHWSASVKLEAFREPLQHNVTLPSSVDRLVVIGDKFASFRGRPPPDDRPERSPQMAQGWLNFASLFVDKLTKKVRLDLRPRQRQRFEGRRSRLILDLSTRYLTKHQSMLLTRPQKVTFLVTQSCTHIKRGPGS